MGSTAIQGSRGRLTKAAGLGALALAALGVVVGLAVSGSDGPGQGDPSADAQAIPPGLAPVIAATTAPEEYHLVPAAAGGFRAANPAEELTVDFAADGLTVRPLGTETALDLSFARIGRAGAMAAPAAAEPVGDGARLEYQRGPITEWYVNDPRGVEQGFTLDAAPEGDPSEPVVVELAAAGDLRPTLDPAGDAIRFEGDERVLSYGGLHAYDAKEKALPATLGLDGNTVTLSVDDEGAAYPITIDPLIVTEEAHLLEDVGVKNALHIGGTVAVDGGTAVLGVPATPVGAKAGVGAVYVFTSDSGAWTEQAHIYAPDGAAGDGFGAQVSIAGNTLVAGAPGDGSAYVYVRTGSTWNQQARIAAPAGVESFGQSLALSSAGDTLVVGAPTDDVAGVFDAGSAYVFGRTGSTWTAQDDLLAPTAAPDDEFAWSVAVDGDTIVVGAHHAGAWGLAHVYERSGSDWQYRSGLVGDQASPVDGFGESVAIDGGRIVVGSPNDDCCGLPATNAMGAAYVFEGSGASWTRRARLVLPDAERKDADDFGTSVAIEGDRVIVGAPNDDAGVGFNQGSIVVFQRDTATPTWSPVSTVRPSDPGAGDQFGWSVSLRGGTTLVGAPNDQYPFGAAGGTNDGGSAYVFDGAGGPQVANLRAATAASSNQFGGAVAIEGNTAVVGAPAGNNPNVGSTGYAFVYQRTGTTWALQARLTPFDPADGDRFGASVAISGDFVLIGAPDDDTDAGGAGAGSAYLFTRTGSSWQQIDKLEAPDAGANDGFGFSVALDANPSGPNLGTAVIGARLADTTAGTDAGSAYVFQRAIPPEEEGVPFDAWPLQAQLTAPGINADDELGYSVAVQGSTVAVGARRDDTPAGSLAGSVFVYERSGTVWGTPVRLAASDAGANDQFGSAVSLSGDTLAVGAPTATLQGGAYVFVRTDSGWAQQAVLRGAGASRSFGISLAVSGDNLVVGAPADTVGTLGGAGVVQVYLRTGTTWTNEERVVASDAPHQLDDADQFGASVGLSGDTAIVGVPFDDVRPVYDFDSGSVYTFRLTPSPQPDVAVTMTDAPDPVVAGNEITYTITVQNTTPGSLAKNVKLNDLTPAGTSFVSRSIPAGWTCFNQDWDDGLDQLTCSRIGGLTVADGPQTFQLTVRVPRLTPGGTTISNTAQITTKGDAAAAGNNVVTTATATLPQPQSDISVTKSVNLAEVVAGQNLTYTVTVANLAAGTYADDVALTDALPAGTTFVSRTVRDGWSCAAQVSGSTSPLSCTRTEMVPETDPQQFTMVVRVPTGTAVGTVVANQASVQAKGDLAATGNNVAGASSTVVAQADIGVTITDAPDPAAVGGPLTYTVTVENPVATSTAASAFLRLDVPGSTTTTSNTIPAGWDCDTVVGGFTCHRPQLRPADGPQVFLFHREVRPSTGDEAKMTATATVSAVGDTATTGNNIAKTTTTALRQADVGVTVAGVPGTVISGKDITYTITATTEQGTAHDLLLTDELPAGTTFRSLAPAAGWDCAPQAVGSTDELSCTRDELRVSAGPQVFTVVVRVDPGVAGGSDVAYTARIRATGDETGNFPEDPNQATATTHVVSPADVNISLTDSPDPVIAGENLTYVISVANPVLTSTATNVRVTSPLPANTTYVSRIANIGWACDPQAAGSTDPLSCTRIGGFTPATGVQTITLVVKPNATLPTGTVISHTATVSATGDSAAAGNNVATTTTSLTARPDVSITKTDSPDPVIAGGDITYAITVENTVAASTATTVRMRQPVSSVSFVSESHPAGWNCTTPAVGGVGEVSCTRATLTPANGPQVFSVVVRAAANLSGGTTLTNTATVTSDIDLATGNNAASTTTTVIANADVRVVVTDTPDPVASDGEISYKLTVRNQVATSTASDVSLTFPIPVRTTFVSLVAPAGWGCNSPAVGSSTTVSCTRPTLTPGDGNQIFSVVVDEDGTTPLNGSVNATATVGATGDTVNNVTTESTLVRVGPDVRVELLASPAEVIPGDNITYTITTYNGSTFPASNVTLEAPLPEHTRFVSLSTASGWTCDPQAVGSTAPLSCDRSALAAGAPSVFVLVVQVQNEARGTTVTNTATVAAAEDPATDGNNVATVSTNVLDVPGGTAGAVVVSMTASPGPVVPGEDILYIITVRNPVVNHAATNVTLDVPIPAGTTVFPGAKPTGWMCGPQANGSTAPLSCTRSTLTFGDGLETFSMHLRVGAGAPAGSAIVTTATVSADDDDDPSGDNVATTSTDVVARADVYVTKTASPSIVAPGENLTYTITVANDVPTSTAKNVVLRNLNPTNTTFVLRDVPDGWVCDPQPVGGTSQLRCLRDTLIPADGDQVFTLVSRVNPGAPLDSQIVDSAVVTATGDSLSAGNNGATTFTTIGIQSDLSVAMTATPDPVGAGSDLTYTITVQHEIIPSVAKVFHLEVPLPAGTTFKSLTTPMTCAPQAVGSTAPLSCDAPSLPSAAGPRVFTLTVAVDPSTPVGSTLSTAATVSATGETAAEGNNVASATVGVSRQADIQATMTVDPDPVIRGEDLAFTITVESPLEGTTAVGAALTAGIPAGTTFAERDVPAGWTCADQAPGSTNQLSCTRASLISADGPQVFTLVVHTNPLAAPGTVIVGSALATAAGDIGFGGNNFAVATTRSNQQGDLVVTLADSPDPVARGADVTYAIDVTDAAANSLARGVTLSMELPVGTTFQSVSGLEQWTCAPQAVGSTTPLSCTRPSFGSSTHGPTEATLVLAVDAEAEADALSATLRVASSGDPNLANNEAVTTTAVFSQADVGVTVAESPDPVVVGHPLTYTITVDNPVARSTATDVVLANPMPTATQFRSLVAPAGWDCTALPVDSLAPLSCTRPTLTPEDGPQVFTLVVNPFNSNTLVSSATRVSATGDTATSGNNVATTTTDVLAQADVRVLVTDAPDPVGRGEELTYTVRVRNLTADSSADTAVAFGIPAGTTFVSRQTAAGWACPDQAVGSTEPLECTRDGVLSVDSDQVFTVVVLVDPAAPASLTATATVSAPGDEAVTGNNVAAATTAVVTQPGVRVTKEVDRPAAAPGDELTYTVTVYGTGPGATASVVKVVDALPAGTTFVARGDVPAGWSCDGQAVGSTDPLSCTKPTLTPDAGPQVFTFTVLVGPEAGGTTVTNTATVRANGDIFPTGNNVASAATAIAAVPDASVSSDGPASAEAGSDVTYTITVENAVAGTQAEAVELVNPIPAGTTFVSRTEPGGWDCTSQTPGSAIRPLSCSRPTLTSGDGPQVFTMTVRIDPALATGTAIVNTARVSAAGDESVGNNVATETTTVTRRPTLTSVSCTGPVVVGQASSCTVTVADAGSDGPTVPTGTVAFTTDGPGSFAPTSCTLLAGACVVSYTASATGDGSHTITAAYGGSEIHDGDAGDVALAVTPRLSATTVSCAGSLILDQAGTCTVTVADGGSLGTASMPTGTVTVSTEDAGALSASTCTLTAGTCTVTYTPSAVGDGSHTITAAYPGSGVHGPSGDDATVLVTLRPTITTVTCTGPLAVGQDSSCTVTVADSGEPASASTPTGDVELSTDDPGEFSDTTCTLAAGTCTVTYTPSAVGDGSHSITGSYEGSTRHAATSDSTHVDATVAVGKRASTTTTSCDGPLVVGQTSSCMVTVADGGSSGTASTPTGTVDLTTDGPGTLGAPTCDLAAGTCTVSYTPNALGDGSHTITAAYRTSQVHDASDDDATVTVTLRPSATTVACNSALVTGQAGSCTVTVADGGGPGTASTPTGTVSLATDGAGSFGPTPCTLTAGSCTVPYTATAAGDGTHTITATYVASAVHAGSSDTANVTVTAAVGAPTQMQASPVLLRVLPLKVYVPTFTATLTSAGAPVAGRPVVFAVGGRAICTATTGANGVASCNGGLNSLIAALAGGYTATFVGDTAYEGSSRAGAVLTIS